MYIYILYCLCVFKLLGIIDIYWKLNYNKHRYYIIYYYNISYKFIINYQYIYIYMMMMKIVYYTPLQINNTS